LDALGGVALLLILNRRRNESVMIGDEIEVSVLAVMGGQVRVGIHAPRSLPILRKEIYLDVRHWLDGVKDEKAVEEPLARPKSD
jgi:carbon storage regulator